MTKSYKERREKLRKERQEKDKEEEQEPTTTSTRTINIEGREVPVRFPIVFESKTPDEILHRRFTIKEPDSNGKVNVYCEAMDEDLMHRLMDVMAELMDKCGVKNFNITTREHLLKTQKEQDKASFQYHFIERRYFRWMIRGITISENSSMQW